jgi:hypothetical protein
MKPRAILKSALRSSQAIQKGVPSVQEVLAAKEGRSAKRSVHRALVGYVLCVGTIAVYLVEESHKQQPKLTEIRSSLPNIVATLDEHKRTVDELDFLHIPKTAGTSIEDYGHDDLVSYGFRLHIIMETLSI